MLYKQDIANLALGHLGVTLRVNDLTNELTSQAKIIRNNFRTSLDTILAEHEWTFATGFAELALNEENPIQGYLYAYALPADCIVMRMIAMDGYFPKVKQYEKEKLKFRNIYNGSGPRLIYTDIQNAHGEYTVRMPEDAAFPPYFGRALSHQLALDIAPGLITQKYNSVKQDLMSTARMEIARGIAMDLGMEPAQDESPTPFISCRTSGY
jgi:hypothetical protein